MYRGEVIEIEYLMQRTCLEPFLADDRNNTIQVKPKFLKNVFETRTKLKNHFIPSLVSNRAAGILLKSWRPYWRKMEPNGNIYRYGNIEIPIAGISFILVFKSI